MIREKLIERGVGDSSKFRWRGHEVARVEALSDAVFAFAVTLLVVSLEVPRTFDELWETMRGFVPFAISFAMLFLVWYQQYIFFRRYALQDTLTTVLNGALLFVVLFYVYPLKFLWTTLVNAFTGHGLLVRLPNGETVPALVEGQWGRLMLIFDAGYIAVFLVFILLYLNAYRRRAQLGLDRLEVFDTWTEIQSNLLSVLVGVLSAALVLVGPSPRRAAHSGWVYLLIGPLLTAHGFVRGAQRRKRYEGRAETPTDDAREA
jgi:Endosomal/lysosomal potassium channel TMEM175